IVIVGPADEEGVHVEMSGWRKVVLVGDRAGLAAARLVALAIAELAADLPGDAPARPVATIAAPAPSPTAPASPRSPARIAVALYRIEGGVNHTGGLAGGGAMVRAGWRLAAAPKTQVFGSFRVDAFANRVSVSVVGAPPSFASPRLAAAAGIGIGWDLGN